MRRIRRSFTASLNADIDRCQNVLTSGVLANAWGSIPSKRKLAVVDACYSGGVRMTKSTLAREKRLSRPQLSALSAGEGSILISSSPVSRDFANIGPRPDQPFYETLRQRINGVRWSRPRRFRSSIRPFQLRGNRGPQGSRNSNPSLRCISPRPQLRCSVLRRRETSENS